MSTYGFILTAADIQQLANETYEELLGYQGKDRGHRPARPDIAKLKQAYDEQNAAKAVEKDPAFANYPDEQAERTRQLAKDWEQKTQMSPLETMAAHAYGMQLQTWKNPQVAFDDVVETLLQPDSTGSTPVQSEGEAKKLLGGAIKKFEYARAPRLYGTIKDTLDDLSRTSTESYKLWPWAVKEVKRQYQENPTGTGRFAVDRQHLIDIVNQTGTLLHELRQNNRAPQGVDANNFKSLKEMEDWLYKYRRENGMGDDGGKEVHDFGDGWKMLKLNDPRQLEWEGQQMNHCVGGYWSDVRDGRTNIYSLRDQENKPRATMEFVPHQQGFWKYVCPLSESTIDPELLRSNGYRVAHYFDSKEQMEGSDGNSAPNPPAVFKEVSGGAEPFVEDGSKDLYNMGTWGMYPASQDTKKAMIMQHMGPDNRTMDSTAGEHFKEWLDHHRNNGWEIERHDGFHHPYDWDEGGNDVESYELGQNGYSSFDSRAADLLEWYDDHYRQNPAHWLGVDDKSNPVDKYGFPKGPRTESPLGLDRDSLDEGIQRALTNNDNRYVQQTGDPVRLAEAYWHAVHVDDPMFTPSQIGPKKRAWDRWREKQEEALDQMSSEARDYHDPTYTHDEAVEWYREHGGQFEQNEDGEEDENEPIDYDLWQEAQDEQWYKEENELFGDNHTFLQHIYHLNDKYGPMMPKQLYNHATTGSFPDEQEVNPQPPAQTGTEDMPGTFSHWVEATSWDDDPEATWQPFNTAPKKPGLMQRLFERPQNHSYKFIWHPPSNTWAFTNSLLTHRKIWQAMRIPDQFDRYYCGYADVNGNQANVMPYSTPQRPIDPQLQAEMRDRAWQELYERHPYLQNGPTGSQEAAGRTGGLHLVSSIMDAAKEALEALFQAGGFSLTSGLAPSDGRGYFAALSGFEEQVSASDLSPASIMAYRDKHMSLLQTDPSLMIGGWLHKGMCFLDMSKVFDTIEDALAFAAQNNQLAIWDGFEGREVAVAEGKVAAMSPWADQFKHIIVVPDLAGDPLEAEDIQAFSARQAGEVVQFAPPAGSLWSRPSVKDACRVLGVQNGEIVYVYDGNASGQRFTMPVAQWQQLVQQGEWQRMAE